VELAVGDALKSNTKWASIGFPFAISHVYAKDDVDVPFEIFPYNKPTGAFWLKTYNGNNFVDVPALPLIAGDGYIAQFPDAYFSDTDVITFSGTGSIASNDGTIAASGTYHSYAHPHLNDITLDASGAGNKYHYKYNAAANNFELVTGETADKTLQPFEAVITVVQADPLQLRSAIGTDNDGTTGWVTPNAVDDAVVATKYYNLQGVEITQPVYGIFIVKQIHESGKTTVTKQFYKL
jgi:hypothetical protein